MALDLKRFIARFVEEARDHFRQIDESIAALDTDPADKETVNALFRAFHTVKGSARMLKLMPIAESAHEVENVLGALREGTLVWSSDLRRLVRRGADALAGQVDAVAEGRDVAAFDPQLLADLAAILGGKTAAAATPALAPPPLPPATAEPPGGARLKTSDTVRVSLAKLDDVIRLMGEVVSSHTRLEQRLADIRRIERDGGAGARSGALAAFARDLCNDVFAQKLLMTSLHDKALAMRMLPLSVVLEPAARLIRELGTGLGKEVECETSGADIELDRQLIDRLGDPLVHLLRNAVDHGIETPQARLAAGKPRHGTIRIGARADGGGVTVEVADNGAGLPLAAIREKAVRKHLVTPQRAAALTDAEAVDLIFTPGFSTSPIVTEVSGRGVGMDVVKRTIVDDLQGMVTVETIPGQGTSFKLHLPLTLAVMRILMVGAGGQAFGFAAQYVFRLLEVRSDKIRNVAERKAVALDSEFVPVVSLAGLIGLPTAVRGEDESLLLVVVRMRGEKMALIVDTLLDERDMVLKPLPAHMRHLHLVAGMVATGRNALISVLHVPVLFDLVHAGRSGTQPADRPEKPGKKARKRVLVVDDSFNAREIVKDILEAHDYDVVLAENGRDGLDKVRAGSIDAVITDVEMPLMDGFTLTALLRAEERYRDLPIIIVTSRAKEEDKRRGISVGADGYIVKGDFNQNSMIETLGSVLG
jgi:two-component system, chemotaxis family, sensor kinase CheA